MTNKRSAQRKPLGPPLIRVQYVRPLAAHDALVDLDDRAEEAPELFVWGRVCVSRTESGSSRAACCTTGPDLCGIQPLVWVVLTKLENSLARSNRSRFG